MGERVQIALVGISESLEQTLRAGRAICDFRSIPYSDSLFENPIEPEPNIIFCGPPTPELSITEVAQTIRMFHAKAPIFYVTDQRNGYQRGDFVKNGFTDAFLIPTDRQTLSAELDRVIAIASDGTHRAFRSVQLIDLEADTKLGFDLYLHLPANQKKVRYVASAETLDSKKIEKLQKHQVHSAMVTEDQMQKFYEYSAQRLKRLGTGSGVSATELKERRERAIRDLFSGIFSDSKSGDTFASGRELMSDCQQILKAYIIDENDSKTSWFAKLLEAGSATGTGYNHAANTATFAGLLSIGLGIGDPKDLALAALLHDIGLADVDAAIVEKDDDSRTSAERLAYQQHPLRSVEIIKQRKIIVTDTVLKIVEQHHERYDGTGYPAKLPPFRMLPEAQILSVADQLDELTTPVDGKPRLSMAEAISKICRAGLDKPSASAVDPEILKNLNALFAIAA